MNKCFLCSNSATIFDEYKFNWICKVCFNKSFEKAKDNIELQKFKNKVNARPDWQVDGYKYTPEQLERWDNYIKEACKGMKK